MAGLEKYFKGVTIGRYEVNDQNLSKDLHKYINKDVVIFCVGTDRSTGDSFAPLIGTLLTEKGYKNVIGTIEFPVHAENIEDRIKEIPEGRTVLAIDACLGKLKNIGSISLNSGALYAGRGVGKELPPVGDFHILGTVNVGIDDNNLNFQVLSHTRLDTVYKMAKHCVKSIEEALLIVESDSNKGKLVKIIG